MWFDGINSSRLIATGDMVNAYLVKGLTTCKRTDNANFISNNLHANSYKKTNGGTNSCLYTDEAEQVEIENS